MCTLASENPNLAAEWDYINNEGLTPDDVSPRSSQVKVWWKCAHGHSWQATVKNRANGTGCPFCSGRAAIKGINDLATVNPGLASEWDYYRNADITPDMIKAKSSRKVWWKCPHGHIWQSTVWNRTKGSGCPYCSGRDAIKGINDLATVNPALALEWDYDRNPGIMPETVKPMSSLKVWWICKEGHSWLADIADRSCGYGCPYCSGRIVLPGINDLATKNPLLAAEWDYERNGDLRPDQVKSGSALKVWWRCGKGHVWQAVIYSRNYGSGCPYCANQAILPGYNDLAALNPELASEWDYEMNYPQHPSSVGLNSRSKVWWR
jgi:DNA-directed RNA polymerase subunit RPC12/RpoP